MQSRDAQVVLLSLFLMNLKISAKIFSFLQMKVLVFFHYALFLSALSSKPWSWNVLDISFFCHLCSIFSRSLNLIFLRFKKIPYRFSSTSKKYFCYFIFGRFILNFSNDLIWKKENPSQRRGFLLLKAFLQDVTPIQTKITEKIKVFDRMKKYTFSKRRRTNLMVQLFCLTFLFCLFQMITNGACLIIHIFL